MFDKIGTTIIVIGSAFAALVSLFRMMQERSAARPTALQIVGRMGTAFAVGYLVGAGLNEWTDWSANLRWGICGFAGFFGDSVFYALAVWVENKYRVNLLVKGGDSEKPS